MTGTQAGYSIESRSKYSTGTLVGLAGIVMFFAAIFSACVVDKGAAGTLWLRMPIPPVLWVDAAILALSSAALYYADVRLRKHEGIQFRRWLAVTLVLGGVFLLGQDYALRSLSATGIGFATSTSSSFFMLLIYAHALCVLGGICALAFAIVRWRRGAHGNPAKSITIYWDAMMALWILTLIFLARVM